MSRPKTLLVLVSLLTGAGLIGYSLESLSLPEKKAAAVALVTICFWAAAVFPEYVTALLFFLLAMLLAVSPAAVVFSGFASTAMWLVFSGLVLAVGITDSGLGRRIAFKFTGILSGGYSRIIAGVVAMGVVFSFFMPAAVGRIILFIPVAQALADHFGFPKGSNGRNGIILATIFGSIVPGFGILPANVPNIVLIGMVETQYGLSLQYGRYLLVSFPVLCALKSVLLIGLILWLYPDISPDVRPERSIVPERMSGKEKILALVIVVLIVLWFLDYLHHISPAWIALGGAVILLLPGIDIVGQDQFRQKVNLGTLIMLAGILGLGGMVHHSGLGDLLAERMTAILPLGRVHAFLNYLSLGLAATVTGMLVTAAGIPAVFTPLCDTLSQVTGLPLETVIMSQVLGYSTTFLPYQLPPLLIAMKLSGLETTVLTKFCLILATVSILFLWPLNYLWWRLLHFI